MMKKSTACIAILIFFTGSVCLSGCGANNLTKGAGIGAAAGAAIGGIIGNQSGHAGQGAVIGGVAGGALGALIGRRLDKQQEELQKVPGMQSVQVDEEKQSINAALQVLFTVNSEEIKSGEAQKLDELAAVFAKYPENIVVIEGHTDSDGSEEYNQKLSEKRARSVENYLRGKRINIASLSSVGYGESRPIASNYTSEGKAANRRVELKISVDPNKVPQEEVKN
ncbi:MAG: OmpA family protein [bacterium]